VIPQTQAGSAAGDSSGALHLRYDAEKGELLLFDGQ
jgi:hypothetical protein